MHTRHKLLFVSLLVSIVLSSVTAQAYVFTFVRQPIPGKPNVGDPSEICVCLEDDPAPGDVIVFDLYLDTQGESEIIAFSLGVLFDPTLVQYDASRSDLADFVLYSPLSSGPAGKMPARWLEPDFDPAQPWVGSKPPGLEQLNIAFVERSFAPTVATATNEWIGRITFIANNAGLATITPSWDLDGTLFATASGELSPDVAFVWVPEPTTALLVGIGLAALSMRRRRI